MTDTERRNAAARFAADWKGRGDEKQETQAFWLALLQKIYGVEEPEKYISFELPVKLDHTSFIDGYIADTRVLIEQKGQDIDLKKGYKQSDGSMLTPFGQARRYAGYLPHDQNPRWIIVCNFQTFEIHDMNRPNDEPEVLALADLEKEYHRLDFLVDTGKEHIKKEMEISLQAGELVGVLYDALLKQYKDPGNPETLKSLNKLCVRLVFCLYAEDAGIFGSKSMFHDYLEHHRTEDRRALINLFRVLDQDIPQRDEYMDDDLAAFPYVNGGLFADEDITIPRLGDEVIDLILRRASEDFDWSDISPTIFGAVFESTLNPETRRSGGMHYTSIENIHKLIDPLFLDGLKAELAEILKRPKGDSWRSRYLKAFQEKLAGLKFLDPACGSGNFLTETYLSLRRLENEIIREFYQGVEGQTSLGNMIDSEFLGIKVSIGQFYGIEINDFAVTVAKTALWIAESQMMRETENIVHMSLDFLPLKSYANITEANALREDWERVVPKNELNYIISNPPFVGYSLQSKEQKDDILSIYVDEKGKPYKTAGKIDYVSGWYFKAAQLMKGTSIRTAFVSTNSITQGEQVAGVWKPLYDRFGIHIDFAHRTFRWDSEASLKAHVHCVIVGFSVAANSQERRLFTSERMQIVENINAYLLDAPNVFIDSRSVAICNIPQMVYGNKPTDGGFLFLTAEERDELLKKEPATEKFIRQIYGATEYINNKARYCLWLVGASPAELRKSAFIMERVEQVKQFRLNSTKAATQKSADTPTLFQEIRHPDSEYIIIPRHSSETRRYIPFGFVSPQIVVNDAVQIIPGAGIYHFGIMMSNVHMAWTRAVCGRIKSDYRYSKDVVYNNFPWPIPTDAQKAKIEQTAQAILDARALYPDSSLADLYDETTMPPELRKAHQMNDKAVMLAYGFSIKDMTESKCVAELMRMYQKLIEK
ncbi:class I SAM-dependent DNA methyltransferase [Pseudoflavonifractor sp. 60]|uniref:class I SAM-dependent DNA methyltransferase n=1 Tax=Pseudoflavonifractor sp. 60 TaxID=2304576 RepID=UPI00136BD01D|nr:class I SAM-dependent DNA methyltransferase [Pseudoflavonifractor sp. 60]NBI66131.1 class I SAM-dependent DNA methyltransferase [Pseudoflavonifractor sp. 60]